MTLTIYFIVQLNEDGSYNKTGMEAGLKKYWSEWSTDTIESINNKCYEEGEYYSFYTKFYCDIIMILY